MLDIEQVINKMLQTIEKQGDILEKLCDRVVTIETNLDKLYQYINIKYSNNYEKNSNSYPMLMPETPLTKVQKK